MDFSGRRLVPYIPPAEYDKIAQEFLDKYYPQALDTPMPIPIEDIAKNEMGLDVRYLRLSEEQDIYGMTIFTDGAVEIYDPIEGLYDTQVFKSKTVLIDPDAVKKTNSGCRNNTIAHECVHWYKHRLFYKRQQLVLPRYAKYCKCRVSQLPETFEEESIMERYGLRLRAEWINATHHQHRLQRNGTHCHGGLLAREYAQEFFMGIPDGKPLAVRNDDAERDELGVGV